MSSTNPENTEVAIKQFCEKEFRPVAEKLTAEGHRFFEHGGNEDADSYYIRRSRKSMRKEDFETPSFKNAAEFAAELSAMWKSQGLDDLASLTPSMARLAEQLQQVEEQSDEVSPFVYVMF